MNERKQEKSVGKKKREETIQHAAKDINMYDQFNGLLWIHRL